MKKRKKMMRKKRGKSRLKIRRKELKEGSNSTALSGGISLVFHIVLVLYYDFGMILGCLITLPKSKQYLKNWVSRLIVGPRRMQYIIWSMVG